MEKLPAEVLIEIFEYCRIEPLTLVNKKFNEVISNSACLMKKMSLVITEKSQYSELMASKRLHQSCIFKFNYKISQRSIEVITYFNKSLKTLELMRCILSAEVFLKILNSLPQLEHLLIYTTYLKNTDQIDHLFDRPSLENLKRLNFRNSDEKFFSFLENSKLFYVHIGHPIQYKTDILENFLRRQPNIKHIEHLGVGSLDDSLMMVISQDLKHIENLQLESDKLDMSKISELELVNYSLKFLNLYGDFSHATDLNLVLKVFKNIRTLEIEMNNSLEPAVALELNQQLLHLESLSIIRCSGEFCNHISIRSLKKFKIADGNFSTEDWTTFARQNPSIEILSIEDDSVTNEIFRIICSEFANLRDLRIFYDPQRLTDEILDVIFSENFPKNVRSLKITQRSLSNQNFFSLSENHKRIMNESAGLRIIIN